MNAFTVVQETTDTKGGRSYAKIAEGPRGTTSISRPPRQRSDKEYKRTILYAPDGSFINSTGW